MYCERSFSISQGTIVQVPVDISGMRSVRWKIKKRQATNPATVVCVLEGPMNSVVNVNSPGHGWVTALIEDGSLVSANSELFKFEACEHHVVMKDLCAECGANLRREGGVSGDRVQDVTAKIPMVHSIPDLHVSESVAAELALQEEQSLLAARKLVLLVDLDQTILHTSNDLQAFKYKNLHRYRLPGSPLIYHTSFRPHLMSVLNSLSKYYEMHICTFGNRVYAHKLASLIDPKRRYFSHRILSRDECFNPVTKSANLKALFPRGLNLVCIIDDRGEVWDWSPNLIHVKPYRFFPDTGDINAFPWSSTTTAATDSTRPPIKPTQSDPQAVTDISDSVDSDSRPVVFALKTEDVNVVENDDSAASNRQQEVHPPLHSNEQDCDNHDTEQDSSIEVSQTTVTTDVCEPDDPMIQSCTASSSISSSSIPKGLDDADHSEPQKHEIDEPAPDKGGCLSDSTLASVPPVTPEEVLHAADANYLLRLQDILISLHRSYFRAYDRWRASQECTGYSAQTDSWLSDTAVDSPSLSSTASSQPSTPQPPIHHHHSRKQTPLPHVADIIAQNRARVLGPACHVTLSGLAPSHIPADRCLAGRIVRSLGAVLHSGLRLPPMPSTDMALEVDKNVQPTEEEVNERDADHTVPEAPVQHKNENVIQTPTSIFTTHLVACRRGTEKVGAATDLLKRLPVGTTPPLHLVSPQWLWACHFHWQHMPERDFPLVQDFHPSEFDSEVEPVPGTHRYARRLRRHHHRHRHHTHNEDHHRHDRHDTQEREQRRHHHRDRAEENFTQSGEASNTDVPTSPRHYHSHHHHRRPHRHHQHHHHHRHHATLGADNAPKHINSDTSVLEAPETSEPNPNGTHELAPIESRLDVQLVQSALDSIRAERKQDREEAKRNRRRARDPCATLTSSVDCVVSKRRRRESSGSSEVSIPVAVADTKSDGLDALPPSKNDEESSSSSSSPSLASSESDNEQVSGKPRLSCVGASRDKNYDQPNSVPIEQIKDVDEADFDDDTVPPKKTLQLTEDGTETGTDGGLTEDGDDVESQLRQFLPPPKSLILADNPLLHLPPQAASQMLAEIEDAVMEEETARAASLPAEAELYDPARLLFGLDDSSSSDSSHSAECEFRGGGHRVSESQRSRHSTRTTAQSRQFSWSGTSVSRRAVDPVESDRRTRRWQVQRELLLRRRCRASASEVSRIDKMLRRLNACFRREERRRRSADDLTITGTRQRERVAAAVSLVPDSDESEDGDMWDADYPKGWAPGDRDTRRSQASNTFPVRFRQSKSGHLRAFSMSPAIHSDPEPTLDWWRSTADAEDPDGREWNTCPEGYDYADAERTRSLLRGDARQHDARQQVHGDARRQGHVNLSQCLFGLDDDEDLDVSADEDDDDEEEEENSSDLSDEDSDDLDIDPEDLSGECWDPLREFM